MPLAPAPKTLQRMLLTEYKFRWLTYTPSVYGQRDLEFKEAEHVDVRETEAEWMARVEQVVAHEKKKGNSVLVYFKNKKFLEMYPGHQQRERLTEDTPPEAQEGYVQASTSKGRVTLLTRGYGRGIDFPMPEGHHVVVVQTFLSSLVSEETQIKGRTARQGKHGKYRMVLCFKHLEEKMAFGKECDLAVLQSGSGEQIKQLLKKRQTGKTKSKVAGMFERRDKAKRLEQATKRWEDLLFDPQKPIETKLQKLAEFNANLGLAQVHYTLLLDRSASMWGEPWRQLMLAYERFRAELSGHVAAADTKVSVILFNMQEQVEASDCFLNPKS